MADDSKDLQDVLKMTLSPAAVAVIASTLYSSGWVTPHPHYDGEKLNAAVQWFADQCVASLGGGSSYEDTLRELGL